MILHEYIRPIFDNNNKKGFHKDWTIKRKLILIISELSEAIESDRNNNRCIQLEHFGSLIIGGTAFPSKSFELMVKDTLEDEIADVFIRICGLIGLCYFGKPFEKDKLKELDYSFSSHKIKVDEKSETFSDRVFDTVVYITKIIEPEKRMHSFIQTLLSIKQLAEDFNIPLQKHVDYKMMYNGTRPFMHGKNY